MKIKRKKLAESIMVVFDVLPWPAATYCPDCQEDIMDNQAGCDMCYPLKKVLHKGY